MRNLWRVAALGAATMGYLCAQQAGGTPAVYASTSSYIVADESRRAYETLAKDRTRKIAQEMLKEDQSLIAVLLTTVMYGGHTPGQPNYFLTVMTQGLPGAITETVNKVTQRLYNKSYDDYLKELYPMRKAVGMSLARRYAGTAPDMADGDYVLLDRKKVGEGRMGDYIQVEQQYQRLREAQAKAGRMKTWSMWVMTAPRGGDAPYDAYTVHVGKDLTQALGWGQGSQEIAAGLSPALNVAGIAMRAQSVSKTVYTDIRRIVFVVER